MTENLWAASSGTRGYLSRLREFYARCIPWTFRGNTQILILRRIASAASQELDATKEIKVETPAVAVLKEEPKVTSCPANEAAETKQATPPAAAKSASNARRGSKKAASKPSSFGVRFNNSKCGLTDVSSLSNKFRSTNCNQGHHDFVLKLPDDWFQTSVSGMGVAEECAEAFSLMKTRSAHKFITYKIDQTEGQVYNRTPALVTQQHGAMHLVDIPFATLNLVVLDITGEADASYETFTSALPDGDCRFAGIPFQQF
eukprot:6577058-Pyramimonas_sp.AAC.2